MESRGAKEFKRNAGRIECGFVLRNTRRLRKDRQGSKGCGTFPWETWALRMPTYQDPRTHCGGKLQLPRTLGIVLPVHVANSIHPPWSEGHEHLTCGVVTYPVVRSSRVS